MARNLNVAVQLAAVDVRRLMSKMDFRSNEAGRTASWESNRSSQSEPISARSFSLSLTPPRCGRRSFVAHHEN